MILEPAARIKVSIHPGAEYAFKKGSPNSTVPITKPRILVWDRGAPVAFLHNGRNDDVPLRVPIEQIMQHAWLDPERLPGATHGGDLMKYLRNWIATLPNSER
jgi:hypothetical protein